MGSDPIGPVSLQEEIRTQTCREGPHVRTCARRGLRRASQSGLDLGGPPSGCGVNILGQVLCYSSPADGHGLASPWRLFLCWEQSRVLPARATHMSREPARSRTPGTHQPGPSPLQTWAYGQGQPRASISFFLFFGFSSHAVAHFQVTSKKGANPDASGSFCESGSPAAGCQLGSGRGQSSD